MSVMNGLFERVATGEYRSPDNKLIRGAFTTEDDSYLLVNINVFEKALSRTMSLEEAEEKYGDIIVQRYLNKQADLKKQKSKDAHAKAVQANRLKGDKTKALVLKYVLIDGLTPSEVYTKGLMSRSTVLNTLRGMCQELFDRIYAETCDTVLADLSQSVFNDFKEANYNYKAFVELQKSGEAAKSAEEEAEKAVLENECAVSGVDDAAAMEKALEITDRPDKTRETPIAQKTDDSWSEYYANKMREIREANKPSAPTSNPRLRLKACFTESQNAN